MNCIEKPPILAQGSYALEATAIKDRSFGKWQKMAQNQRRITIAPFIFLLEDAL